MPTFQYFSEFYKILYNDYKFELSARYLQKLKSPSEAFWGWSIAVSLSENVPHMSLAFQPFFMILVSMCFVYNKLNYNHLILLIYKLKFFVL